MTADVAERVARGVAWMDAAFPNWFRRVDLGTLRMNSARFCILGQMDPENPIGPMESLSKAWPLHAAGFSVTPKGDRPHEEYEDLRIEWTRVIRQRLETAA